MKSIVLMPKILCLLEEVVVVSVGNKAWKHTNTLAGNFHLITYAQNGSRPRGGLRIDGSVQALQKNTFIHKVSGNTKEFPRGKWSWKTR